MNQSREAPTEVFQEMQQLSLAIKPENIRTSDPIEAARKLKARYDALQRAINRAWNHHENPRPELAQTLAGCESWGDVVRFLEQGAAVTQLLQSDHIPEQELKDTLFRMGFGDR